MITPVLYVLAFLSGLFTVAAMLNVANGRRVLHFLGGEISMVAAITYAATQSITLSINAAIALGVVATFNFICTYKS